MKPGVSQSNVQKNATNITLVQGWPIESANIWGTKIATVQFFDKVDVRLWSGVARGLLRRRGGGIPWCRRWQGRGGWEVGAA